MQSKLLSQSNCEKFKMNYEVIENMRASYFPNINNYIVLFPCDQPFDNNSGLYSCLNFENCLNLSCDSVRMILICSKPEENQFEFNFVRLLQFRKIPEEQNQLSFDYSSDFTTVVTFKIEDGLVIEEIEMDCEPQ